MDFCATFLKRLKRYAMTERGKAKETCFTRGLTWGRFVVEETKQFSWLKLRFKQVLSYVKYKGKWSEWEKRQKCYKVGGDWGKYLYAIKKNKQINFLILSLMALSCRKCSSDRNQEAYRLVEEELRNGTRWLQSKDIKWVPVTGSVILYLSWFCRFLLFTRHLFSKAFSQMWNYFLVSTP